MFLKRTLPGRLHRAAGSSDANLKVDTLLSDTHNMERLVLRLAPPMVSNKMRTHDLDAVDQARLYSPYSTVLGNTGKLPGYYCIYL